VSIADELQRYVVQHFVSRSEFVRAAAIDDQFLQSLVDADAVPSAIYKIWAKGTIWSPIGGWVGPKISDPPSSEWYSPAALWWTRRAAALHSAGMTDIGAIAAQFRDNFTTEFRTTVNSNPKARVGYVELFENGQINDDRCRTLALSEWGDWINGGYGVCLRRFDAAHLVAKTSESARIRQLTDAGTKSSLSLAERIDLLDALERLDAVMLPFAPHERPHGTPGKWIDATMQKYGLGAVPLVQHRSSAIPMAVDDRLCA
jgi:hypothetical protein